MPSRPCGRRVNLRGTPSEIAEFDDTEDDVPVLVDGAIQPQRLRTIAPRQGPEADLGHVMNASTYELVGGATDGR